MRMYQILMKGFGPWLFLLHRITAVKSQYIYSSIVFFSEFSYTLAAFSADINKHKEASCINVTVFFLFLLQGEEQICDASTF